MGTEAVVAGGATGSRRRIRVLHVIDSLDQGGAQQLLVTLARSIDTARFDLRVCSLHTVDEQSPAVASLHEAGIPVHGVPSKRWHDPRHVTQVASLARRSGIDIVHGHLPYATTVSVLAGKIIRRATVATLHSIRDVHPKRRGLTQAINWAALRRGPRVIVACSPEVAAAARRSVGIPESRLVVVPNAVEDMAFALVAPRSAAARRRELLGGRGGPLVVTVGAMVPAKGHDVLVAAVPALLAGFPSARVVIVGPTGVHEPVIRGRVAALGVEEAVLIAGLRRDVQEILAAADLFVLPSLWEGLPVALLEAMASGTPVVATDVGGVPGVVTDQATGRRVAPGDFKALARAMIDLLRRPDHARALALTAKAQVQARHGAKAWADRLSAIYESIAGPRPRDPARYAGRVPGDSV